VGGEEGAADHTGHVPGSVVVAVVVPTTSSLILGANKGPMSVQSLLFSSSLLPLLPFLWVARW